MKHRAGEEVALHLFLISAVDGGANRRHAPAVLSTGIERRYQFYRTLGGPQG